MTRQGAVPAPLHQEAAEARQEPRRLRLIAAAEDIFLAKGYHAATMNEVAKAAGMSKKTVYTLIESKADLFAALLEHHQSLIEFPAPRPDWTLREGLTANLLCLSNFLLSPRQIAVLRLIMTEYTHSPELGRIFHRRCVVKTKTRLELCLRDLVEDRPCLPGTPDEMAALLIGMALGEFHFGALIGFRPLPNAATLERRVRQAVAIFLDGCFSAGRDPPDAAAIRSAATRWP